MWKESTSWNVSWSGVTTWGDGYSDSKYFDKEREAAEFCVELSLNDGVYYINLEKSIVWERRV